MNAVISGTAGKALLIEGESLTSFDVDDPSERAVRRQSDLPYLFGEGRDLRLIKDADLDSIIKELKTETDFTLALDLTLLSLDYELEGEIRKEAIQDLDGLLDDNELTKRLEGIMYARPLPDEADLDGALEHCDEFRSAKTFAFFDTLGQRQHLINKVSAAWDVIPTKFFSDYEHKSNFQNIAVRAGLFRSLVLILEGSGTISEFLVGSGLNPSIQQLRNYRQILPVWCAPFRTSSETLQVGPEDQESETEVTPRRRHGRRIGLNRRAVLREVNKKKGMISAAIQRRELGRVQELVDDLVSFQRSSGETEHLAKSLCDLAMEAKELGMFSLQLQLTERSIGEVPDDAWSWAQYGDALLRLRRFAEALTAFEQSETFGEGPVAKTGRAEVLKAQGRLDDALVGFDEVIRQHPEQVVAKAGRAEVLKAQGRLDDALAAYDEVIRQHPEQVVAKAGRAEVLKAQGRLDDALAAFDEVIRQHPEQVVAKAGRAEVLKAQGRLDDALAAFDEVIRQHPENAVAKTGRAEVLKAQGRLDDALVGFDEVIRQHPENAVAKAGRAEVLKAQGRLDDALAAFEEVIIGHPENRVARTGRLSMFALTGRYDDALSTLTMVEPSSLDDWVDYHILGMIRLRTGRMAEAIRIFDNGVRRNPWPSSKDYFSRALALAWLRGHEFKKAGQALEEVKAPQLQPAANVLRIHAFGGQGNVERAMSAYESLSSVPQLRSDELTQELHHQFILRQPPRRNDEWLIDHEARLLILAA